LLRGQLAQGFLKAGHVVGVPRRADLLRVGDVRELRDVQALVPQLAVERFAVAIVLELARARVVALYAARVRHACTPRVYAARVRRACTPRV